MKSTETVERLEVAAESPLVEPVVVARELDAPLVNLPVPQRAAEHRYRLAATRLEAALDTGMRVATEPAPLGRLIIVTSAEDGDGKTTTALHLAAAMSQALGRRTALVEAD